MSQTLFKGIVDEIDQIGGYFALVDMSYKEYDKLGFKLSSQEGDISLVITKSSDGKFRLTDAYFDEDKNFTDDELSQKVDLVYREIKKIFRKTVQVRGYIDPQYGKINLPMGEMDLTHFLMELSRKYDHDTRAMSTTSPEQAEQIIAESKQEYIPKGTEEGNQSDNASEDAEQ